MPGLGLHAQAFSPGPGKLELSPGAQPRSIKAAPDPVPLLYKALPCKSKRGRGILIYSVIMRRARGVFHTPAPVKQCNCPGWEKEMAFWHPQVLLESQEESASSRHQSHPCRRP